MKHLKICTLYSYMYIFIKIWEILIKFYKKLFKIYENFENFKFWQRILEF